MSNHPCPCDGSCNCHGGGAFRPACSIPGGCGSVRPDDAGEQPAVDMSRLCVLGCADRTVTDVWPRPPRPRVDGQLTCRQCTDRIVTTLTEVFELAVSLDLVTAAGSASRTGDGGRKRIKDEPVAPVPVSVPAAALTDVRSRRGTWVPAPFPAAAEHEEERAAVRARLPLEDLLEVIATATRALDRATAVFGARSDQARAAATELTAARGKLAAATLPRQPPPRSIDPRDGDPASVVGFLDRWTDRVRIGRQLLGAGTCPTSVVHYVQIRTGPFGTMQDWPYRVACGRSTEYRRLVRIEMGAHTTGLFALCPAGHVSRPPGQGDLATARRGGHGHRPGRGVRYGLTLLSAVELLTTHNEWVCAQDWVGDYWRGLRELRADLGRAHGEPRPSKIGDCPNGTGDVDDQGNEIRCGQPLYASPYSDTIECQKCGRTWTHREWRFLGRTLGVIA